MNYVSNLIMDQAAQSERKRLECINKAWDAYYGNLPKPLKVKPGQADDNIALNFSSLIVDKGVSFLFGNKVSFEVKPDGESTEDVWLDKCWEANKLMTTLHELGTNGGVAGHVFVKLKAAGGAYKYPRVIVPDPATVFPTLDPEDYKNVLKWRIQWNAIDPVTSKPMVRRQMITPEGNRWRIVDEVSKGDNARWDLIGQDIWPYSWAPVLNCQNLPHPNVFWGRSDLEEDIVDVNKAINFLVSNIGRIIRFHAHPKTWGSGFQADQLKVGIDETIVLPTLNAKLENLEMRSDLGSSLEFFKRLKESLHEIARVPEIATGKMENIGTLSGVAIKILYQALIEKTQTKQTSGYGELLKESNMRLLEMGGFGEEIAVTTQWPVPLPEDQKEEAETGLLLDQIGVSKDTIQTRLGFDAEDEAKKKEAERKTEQAYAQAVMGSFDKGQIGTGNA